MIVLPIPLNLLPHTIEYAEIISDDGWDNKYKEYITIEHVRITEEAKTTVKGGNEKGTNYNTMLIMDRTNSTPFLEIKEDSKISWNGKEYTVKTVKSFYDGGKVPHHYEIGLII